MNSLKPKATLGIALAMAATLAGAQNISVTVDGKEVNFPGTGPQYRSGRVLVPLRGVFENMGAYVDWDPARRLVTASKGNSNVSLHIGDHQGIVNGQSVTLDVPAMVVGGRTLVPIRFLSESLGAQVRWDDPTHQVQILTTSSGGQAVTTNQERRQDVRNERAVTRHTLLAATVIPVTLDDGLSSDTANTGDRFAATVRTEGGDYAGLPAGTKLLGRVISAKAHTGDKPGLLELGFTAIKLPDGQTYNIDGSLIDMNSKGIDRRSDGTIVAHGDNANKRMVYAGYGAGAGLIVGLLTKKPLEGTILGGILGYIAGNEKERQTQANDVRLQPGTAFGVRLNSDVSITG